MGARGPKRTAATLRSLQGTMRADRADPTEVAGPPLDEMPPPPDDVFMDADARQEWEELGPELLKLGLLTRLDLSSFKAYCLNHGVMMSGFRGLETPARREEAMENFKVFGAMFGLSPLWRSKIRAPQSGRQKENPFADLKGGAG